MDATRLAALRRFYEISDVLEISYKISSPSPWSGLAYYRRLSVTCSKPQNPTSQFDIVALSPRNLACEKKKKNPRFIILFRRLWWTSAAEDLGHTHGRVQNWPRLCHRDVDSDRKRWRSYTAGHVSATLNHNACAHVVLYLCASTRHRLLRLLPLHQLLPHQDWSFARRSRVLGPQ